MFHSWRHLTFLHWEVGHSVLQALLPPGLKLDLFQDKAYVGLVPFTMRDIRINGLPRLPGLSASHETNVRTYVVGPDGTKGVWFFSLDAENLAFVYAARAWYHLNYVPARMSVDAEGDTVTYSSQRSSGGREVCGATTTASGPLSTASSGSLDEFLVERYALFAYARGRLYRGEVWHEPYPLRSASVTNVQEDIVKAAQIVRPEEEPLVHFSPGVDVEVFPVSRV